MLDTCGGERTERGERKEIKACQDNTPIHQPLFSCIAVAPFSATAACCGTLFSRFNGLLQMRSFVLQCLAGSFHEFFVFACQADRPMPFSEEEATQTFKACIHALLMKGSSS